MSLVNNNSGSDDNESIASDIGTHEQDKLDKFRAAVIDLEQDDKTLIRFLRAREYNLEKAEDMIRASMKWRKENDMDSYADWQPPKYLEKEFKILFKIPGKDHDGRVVVYIPVGGFLARESIEAGHKEDVFKWILHMLESAMRAIRASGHTQVVALLGLENLTMRQIVHMETMQTLYKAFQTLEQNYPEILRHFFIINAPWLFSIAYNFVKPILSANTVAKLQVYDSNKSKYLPRLLDAIPIETIPEKYLDD